MRNTNKIPQNVIKFLAELRKLEQAHNVNIWPDEHGTVSIECNKRLYTVIHNADLRLTQNAYPI